MVFAGCFHSSIHDLHHIIWNQLALSTDLEPRIISLHEFPMLHKLRKFCFGQEHQTINFSFWSVKVFKAKSIDCDSFHSTLIANLQDLI